MAAEARLQRTAALISAERLVGTALLPDRNPILVDTAEVTHARFENLIAGPDNRRLALRARSHHPLNQSVYRLAILCDCDLDPVLHTPVSKEEMVDRIAQRPVRQILRKHAARSRDHGMRHSGLLMQPRLRRMTRFTSVRELRLRVNSSYAPQQSREGHPRPRGVGREAVFHFCSSICFNFSSTARASSAFPSAIRVCPSR